MVMMNRRYFLKSGGLALASFAAVPSFMVRTAAAQTNRRKPIIIGIFQRGAVDGISMVVPFGDPSYKSVRPQIAFESRIDLDGFYGLHPSLDALQPIYDTG